MALALAQHLPQVAARIPAVALGDWPTPLLPLEIDGRPIWVKDEGASSALYGGNKIRTLEMWFGHARERGARRIWAIGAYGSNHVIATILHAPRAGLEAGAILFPQPTSEWAVENCSAVIASGARIVRAPNIALMPFIALDIARRERGESIVMPPGGATPVGTMGALSGVFELAMQIEAGLAPPPQRIVVGVGSTCTISGLVAGLSLAQSIGVWRWPLPIVHGVRVTPWPVTSATLVADLAARTLARIERLGGPRVVGTGRRGRPIGRRELMQRFVIDGNELGRGYGRITPRAEDAIRTLARLDASAPHATAPQHASALHASALHASALHASPPHASTPNASAPHASAPHASAPHASAPHATAAEDASRRDPSRSEPSRADADASRSVASRPDASRPDASRPDASRPDASRPDASRLDASRLDASRLDASRLDASRSDASRPDASRLDASRSDASRLDASRLDASRLDASRLDASRLDASRLDASRLDASRLDASRLDASCPEASPADKLHADAVHANAVHPDAVQPQAPHIIISRDSQRYADVRGPRLDGVYTAKAAAALLRLHRENIGPLIFWASKSHTVLDGPKLEDLRHAHPALLRWLRR